MNWIHLKIKRKVYRASIIAVILMTLVLDSFGTQLFSYAETPVDPNSGTSFKHILILNSYDVSYRWTSEQSNAISNRLKDEFEDILIFVEFMDTKYHPETENLEQLYSVYKYKYKNKRIDLIYATDNDALCFAIKHRRELFSDAPVVFSGVTKDSANIILAGAENVVGVYEDPDPLETVKSAVKINPELKWIYVISDNTQSGIDSKKMIREDLAGSGYNLIFYDMLSIEEITKRISKLSNNSIILLGAYTSDTLGYRIPAEKFSNLIGATSPVPVYDLWNFRLGHGVLGGMLLSGDETGRNAADLGISILRGKPIDKLDNIDSTIGHYIYDYKQLERFQIPLTRLPEGSIIINKPFSFFETYKYLVMGTVLAFGMLLAFILILVRHINKRIKAEKQAYEAAQELRLSEEKYRMVAEATNDIIWDWDIKNDKIHYSSGILEVLGYEESEISRREDWMKIVIPEDYNHSLRQEIEQKMEQDLKIPAMEYRVYHKSGDIVWISTRAKTLFDESGNPSKLVGSHTDITKLKEYQNRILEVAYTDELTKLPNRAYLKEFINSQIKNGTGETSALIYFDIDDFKSINDNFGHTEGDMLLVEIGRILNEIAGVGDLVCRQGGDEFIIVLNYVRTRNDISAYIERLKDKLANPITLSQGEFHITFSGGIVMYPADGRDYDTLLKNADIAMYFVKNNGKNGLMYFNSDMMAGAKEKLLLDHHLRAAVKKMDFGLHFQPIVDIKTGKISKFEALIRWHDRELGQVSPSVFINAAETNGLIVPIGNWVLEQSCLFAADLAAKGYPNVSVSVNISPIQLRQKDFVKTIMDTIARTGTETDQIELEITESVLIDSLEASLKTLSEIKALGISISLDDFGQGYSSLTYLRLLPINTLKIDKAFLDNYSDSGGNDQIICAIIELAHGMNIAVVAEGVETKEQLEFLYENKCDMAQGYYYSKPVPEAEALKSIDAN